MKTINNYICTRCKKPIIITETHAEPIRIIIFTDKVESYDMCKKCYKKLKEVLKDGVGNEM